MTSLLDPNVTIETRNGRPCLLSGRFDDLYFSAENGLAETELVFIEANDLPHRMATATRMVIAETGFGTGLNFLALLRHWTRLGEAAPVLHYITTEIAPLPAEIIRDVLSSFPEIKPLLDELLLVLPPRWPGRHSRYLFGGKVTIDFLYGDSLTLIRESQFQADAWFLDGFAPSNNPDMWQPEFFSVMASRSAPDASFGSFTAAGSVRTGLSDAGFYVERLSGYGNKRHRIKGRYKGKPAHIVQSCLGASSDIVIIGAGIAGASVAAALKPQFLKGQRLLVLGAGEEPADGASGNIAALQAPRLTALGGDGERLSIAAYGHARWLSRFYGADLADKAVVFAANDRQVERYNKLQKRAWPQSFLSQVQGEDLEDDLGFAHDYPALVFHQGGGVDPRRLTKAMLDNVDLRFGIAVERIKRFDDGRWRLITNQGEITADCVVLAAGAGAAKLTADWVDPLLPLPLPLQITAGRVSHLPKEAVAFNHALSFNGYMVKASDGQIALGASFERDVDLQTLPVIDAEAHAVNWALLPDRIRNTIPDDFTTWQGRGSFRCSTTDRLPVAGDLGGGLFALMALGAHGMTLAPLLGVHVAGLITGAPSPLDQGMIKAVSPYRFSARAGF